MNPPPMNSSKGNQNQVKMLCKRKTDESGQGFVVMVLFLWSRKQKNVTDKKILTKILN